MSPVAIQDILERAKGSAQVGDHGEAVRLLKMYLARTPDSREAHLLLGTTLAKQGKLQEAGEEFNTLLVKNPSDMEALNNIAVIYRRQGKLQDALAALIDAIDINPSKVEFHYNIGNIHKQLGNLSAASMAYARVIELDPNFVPVYNNLGTIYEQLREYDKAFNIFRKGLLLDRNNPTLHFNFGIALEAKGLLEEAANEYKLALRSKPGWLDPMNNLGIILFKQGQHDKALSTFNRILNTDPFNAEARNNMGVVLADLGKTKEAVQNYRRALEADPKYVKAVVNLERTLEESGDFADALIELEKLVKLTPDSAEVRVKLAGLYLKMERLSEALEEVQAALKWDPENIGALRIEGMVQRLLGNDLAAKEIFEHILSIDPINFSFLLDLADIHLKRKEYKEAEERINAFLLRRPHDREAKLLLGKLYAEMGNRTHAIQVFEELAKADPTDAEALAAAAGLHKDAGSIEKALRAADTLVNLQGKRATSEDLSELNKSLEFYENAVNAYSTSVREMWKRNINLATGIESPEEDKDDISLLLGAAGTIPLADEETETLFIEDEELLDDDTPHTEYFTQDDEDFFGEEPEDTLERLADYGDPYTPYGQGQSGAQAPDYSAMPQPDFLPESMPYQGQGALPQYPPSPEPGSSMQGQPPGSNSSPMDGIPPDLAPQYPSPAQPPEPELSSPPDNGILDAANTEPVFDDTMPAEDMPSEDMPAEAFLSEEAPEDFASPDELSGGGSIAPDELLSGEDLITADEPFAGDDSIAAEPAFSEDTSFAPDKTTGEQAAPGEPASGETSPAGAQTISDETGQMEMDTTILKIHAMVSLINYLKKLTNFLPEKDRHIFMRSDIGKRIDSIISTLKGQKPDNSAGAHHGESNAEF